MHILGLFFWQGRKKKIETVTLGRLLGRKDEVQLRPFMSSVDVGSWFTLIQIIHVYSDRVILRSRNGSLNLLYKFRGWSDRDPYRSQDRFTRKYLRIKTGVYSWNILKYIRHITILSKYLFLYKTSNCTKIVDRFTDPTSTSTNYLLIIYFHSILTLSRWLLNSWSTHIRTSYLWNLLGDY